MLEAWLQVSTLADGKRLWAFHDPDQGYCPSPSSAPDKVAAEVDRLVAAGVPL